MAHPDLIALARRPDAFEQRARRRDRKEGAAELAVVAALDLAAELLGHRLLAVADAEHRHARRENGIGCPRRTVLGDGRRSAGHNHGFRLELGERLGGVLEGMDFRIDAGFAHASRDELRHLASKIDDENGVGQSRGDPLFRAFPYAKTAAAATAAAATGTPAFLEG